MSNIINDLTNKRIILEQQSTKKLGVEYNGKKGIQDEELIEDLNGDGIIQGEEALAFIVNNVRDIQMINNIKEVLNAEMKKDLDNDKFKGYLEQMAKMQETIDAEREEKRQVLFDKLKNLISDKKSLKAGTYDLQEDINKAIIAEIKERVEEEKKEKEKAVEKKEDITGDWELLMIGVIGLTLSIFVIF